MQIHRCGAEAVLVELDRIDEALGLREALQLNRPPGVTELVPGARTLLVRYDPAQISFRRLAGSIAALPRTDAVSEGHREVVVPVRYDGCDLATVADHAGVSADEVVERHTAGSYTVAIIGFAPGFAYLTGLDPALQVPRLATPQVRVPAGSVAIADRYTRVYPRPCPGGWQLIGSTELPVWDVEREPPALLTPGTLVRFEALR